LLAFLADWLLVYFSYTPARWLFLLPGYGCVPPGWLPMMSHDPGWLVKFAGAWLAFLTIVAGS